MPTKHRERLYKLLKILNQSDHALSLNEFGVAAASLYDNQAVFITEVGDLLRMDLLLVKNDYTFKLSNSGIMMYETLKKAIEE